MENVRHESGENRIKYDFTDPSPSSAKISAWRSRLIGIPTQSTDSEAVAPDSTAFDSVVQGRKLRLRNNNGQHLRATSYCKYLLLLTP